MNEQELREVRKYESIYYGCGCTWQVVRVDDGIPVQYEPDTICDQHDLTLAKNAEF